MEGRMVSRFALAALAAIGVAAVSALGFSSPKADAVLLVALKFDPQGMLYAADARNDRLLGLALEEKEAPAKAVKIGNLSEQLAKALDAGTDPVTVQDVAVHPASHAVYLSASKKGGGGTLLFRVAGDKLEKVDLGSLKTTSVALPAGARPFDVVVTAKDVVVSSMNRDKTFGSALHRIALPLKEGGIASAETEIYHTSHKRWETKAPLVAMAGFSSGGQEYIMGSTACTPVVRIGVSDVADKKKVQTATVVELGSRNAPVSMLVYTKDSQQSLLVTNNKEGAYKVAQPILAESAKLNEKAVNRGAGVAVETVESWKGAKKSAILDAGTAVVVRDAGDGSLSLETLPLP
jgi:hypothetical protein